MKLYRFSPIASEEQLLEAAVYVAEKASELSEAAIGKALPIKSVTVFSHYPQEFERLKQMLDSLGVFNDDSNGPRMMLHKPFQAAGNTLSLLRVRKPDPYRMQAGCADFDVPSYPEFKEAYAPKNLPNIRLVERPDYEMYEFFHPDYDVLAYVVSK